MFTETQAFHNEVNFKKVADLYFYVLLNVLYNFDGSKKDGGGTFTAIPCETNTASRQEGHIKLFGGNSSLY